MLFLNAKPSDDQLVRRVLRGRKEDFRLLVERYLGVVEAVAYAHVRNQTDAEDVAQSAFLKAFISLDSLREPAKFGAWIRTITRNAAVTVQRTRQRDAALRDALPDQPNAEEQDLDRRELRELLRREIDQLDENQREILLLFYFADKSLREIAALLDSTPNAAKKRLHRARAALSTRLTDEIGDLLKTDRASRTTVGTIMTAIAATQATWETAVAATALTTTGALHTLAAGKFIVGAGIAVACMVIITVSLYVLARHVPMPGWSEPDGPEIEAATVPDTSPAIGDETTQATGTTDADNPILLAEETAASASESNTNEEGNISDYHILSGVVLDTDEQPVPGAIVWAVTFERSAMKSHDTITDANGEFTLRLDDGRWSVKARQDTFSGEVRIGIEEEEPLSPITVTLERGGSLHGTLLDADTGQPLPHGRIWLDEGVVVSSDGAGYFTYQGLPMSDHHLYAITPGYERKNFLFDTTLRDDAGIVLRVSRAGAVQGQVVNEYGNPIPGATVGSPASGHTIALKARFTTTDQNGYFIREGVGFGLSYWFTAQADGYEEAVRRDVKVSLDDPTIDLLFVLTEEKDDTEIDVGSAENPLRVIQGTVVSDSGEPVTDAEVTWAIWERQPKTVTDEFGGFRLDRVPDEEGALLIVAEGFVPKHTTFYTGHVADIEITLSEGETVTGVVVDTHGDPVEGVNVTPTLGTDIQRHTGKRTTTDAEGRFELKAFDSSTMRANFMFALKPYDASASTFDPLNPTLSTLMGVALNPPPKDNELIFDIEGADHGEVVLPSGSIMAAKAAFFVGLSPLRDKGAVRGKVVLPDGSPASEYTVFIQMTRKGSNGGGLFAGYQNIGIQFANRDGEFVVSELHAGKTYRVGASAPGYGDVFVDPVQAEVIDALPPADDLLLTLPKAKDVYIQVAHADDEFSPISDAHVLFLQRKNARRYYWPYTESNWVRKSRKNTDAEGVAQFYSLPYEDATMVVRARGYARELLLWNALEPDITVAMKPEAVISGTAFDQYGNPLLKGIALLTKDTVVGGDVWKLQFQKQIKADAPGAFLFEELPAGEYTLLIHHRKEWIAQTSLTLDEGDLIELTTDDMGPVKASSVPASVVFPN